MSETPEDHTTELARLAELERADCKGSDPRSGPDGEGCDSVGDCPTCYGDAGEELATLRTLAATYPATELLDWARRGRRDHAR